jgi:DNA-binding NarL/FixJ family response regulator
MKRPRVLLADDHCVVAEGLRSLLEPHFEVVGIASDGRQLLAAAKTFDPDVIVLDISMPALNGIDAARQLREAGSRAIFVFLTMHDDVAYAERALEAGATGFVLKHSAPSELLTAVHEALKGGTYISPQIARNLFRTSRSGAHVGAQRGVHSGVHSGQTALSELTPRQREVLQLVADGCSAKEIATTLSISRRTAEFHKARLMDVLGVNSIAGLVQYAIRTAVTVV